jgi:hypothetical protein
MNETKYFKSDFLLYDTVALPVGVINMESFRNAGAVWPHISPNLSADRMVAAGLYFKPGPKSSSDRVVCLHCDGQLENWSAGAF